MKTYEDLLSEKYSGIGYTYSECFDGWNILIDSALHEMLQYINNRKDKDELKDFKIVQIKSKFGGLRIYCNFTPDYIDGIISLAESLSYKTCELCGSCKEVTTEPINRWIWTLCSSCRNEKLKKLNHGII